MVNSTHTRNLKFNLKQYNDRYNNIILSTKLLTPTPSSSPREGNAGSKVSPEVIGTIAVIATLMNQKQSPKLLTGSETLVVDVTKEDSVSREEKDASGNDSNSGEEIDASGKKSDSKQLQTLVLEEEIDVPTKKASYNPFDDMVDVDKEKTSTNPFDEIADVSGKETAAPKETFVSKKGGLDWDPNWTSAIGDLTPSKPTFIESMKDRVQALSRHKVAIAAGSILTVLASGGAAAYFFYPVATTSCAMAALKVGGVVAIGTHAGVATGVANSMVVGSLLMKLAVVPAAQVTASVVFPIIITVAVTTLGAFGLLYVANKAWGAAKCGVWNGGSFVANAFSEQLDQTMPGQAVKTVAITIASPYVDLFKVEAESAEEIGEMEFGNVDSSEETSEEIGDQSIASTSSQEGKRKKAQKKAKTSFARKIVNAGLMTAGLGLGGYLVYKMMPDLNVFGK